MSSFITPIIVRFTAELEAAVETAKANILAEFAGISQARSRGPAIVAKTTAARSSNGSLPKGQKRTPEDIAALTEAVFFAIKANPGKRIEQLAELEDLSTKEMLLPIKRLRAAKRITTAGEKRATTYSIKGAK